MSWQARCKAGRHQGCLSRAAAQCVGDSVVPVPVHAKDIHSSSSIQAFLSLHGIDVLQGAQACLSAQHSSLCNPLHQFIDRLLNLRVLLCAMPVQEPLELLGRPPLVSSSHRANALL